MIVTIGGNPGSGKTVVGTAISEKLKYPIIDIGGLRRVAAKEKRMTLEEFNTWSETHPKEGDVFFDDFVKKEVKKKNNCIVVGRLAYFLFPQALKLYLKVDVEIGAKRIIEQRKKDDKRNEDPASSIAEQKEIILKRMHSDTKRYLSLYGTDCYDEKNFDIVIDSTNKSINEVVKEVLDLIEDFKKKKSIK